MTVRRIVEKIDRSGLWPLIFIAFTFLLLGAGFMLFLTFANFHVNLTATTDNDSSGIPASESPACLTAQNKATIDSTSTQAQADAINEQTNLYNQQNDNEISENWRGDASGKAVYDQKIHDLDTQWIVLTDKVQTIKTQDTQKFCN